jgi:hypothetical protein
MPITTATSLEAEAVFYNSIRNLGSEDIIAWSAYWALDLNNEVVTRNDSLAGLGKSDQSILGQSKTAKYSKRVDRLHGNIGCKQ